MISESIFRENDIRGTYPEELNELVIKEIAKGIAKKCFQENISSIVVGRDGRLSGESMLKTLTGGVDELEKLIEKSVKLGPLEKGQSALEMQVKDLGKTLVTIEKKVQDLYVIKQAEMESVLKGLSRNE